jgi:hypothetical protein
MGHSAAGAKGEAALNGLRVEWEEERRLSAQAYGNALAQLGERLERERARADAVERDLASTRLAQSRTTQALQRRIAHATRVSHHSFSVDFVRLYNEAIGIPHSAVPSAVGSPGAAGAAGAAASPDAGLLERFDGVSEADLLAHITVYGSRCVKMEAQLAAWRELAQSWRRGEGAGAYENH